MVDRSNDTSGALTEIRTVRSRAISAREALALNGGEGEVEHLPGGMDDEGYFPPGIRRFRDPDADEIDAALAEFIEKTAKFAKRGGRSSSARPGRI